MRERDVAISRRRKMTMYGKHLGFVVLVSLLLVQSCEEETACSPCGPGTYPSDPSEACSACDPCPDGGTDGGANALMIWCGMGTNSTDAANDK
jgi:hypothetical protein